jgi:hypothetical protein
MHPNDIKVAALTGLVAFALCALPRAARAREQHVACPASVDASQVQERPISTAVPSPAGTLQLRGAEPIFAFGPLRDAAWGELKDPPTTRKGDVVIAKYELPSGADKYVVCYYGDRFYRALKLPPATNECDVAYRTGQKAAKGGKATYGISDIVCR